MTCNRIDTKHTFSEPELGPNEFAKDKLDACKYVPLFPCRNVDWNGSRNGI